MTKRILVVEDQEDNRQILRDLLASADYEMDEAENGEEALAAVAKQRPDLILMDIKMPVMDGVAAAGPLSERAKVLMLSYSEDEQLVTGAIRNGAAGYLVHGRFEPEDLESRIKAIAAGEMVLSPAITPAVFEALRRSPGTENEADELGMGSLTAREREVLNLLARGMSNAAIAEALVVTERAVEKHVTSIFSKLDLVPTVVDHRRVLAVLAYMRSS